MLTTRTLEAHERAGLDRAILVAVDTAPYFAAALYQLRPVAAPGLGTFAVDRHWRLYLDPACMQTWGTQASGAVLIHEVNHLLREHAERSTHLPHPISHTRWNYATDAAINADLIDGGITLPEGAVTPEALGLPAGGIEEGYYHLLTMHDDEQAGCGSGAGDPEAPWELPTDDPDTPALTPAAQSRARTQVARDIIATVDPGSGIGASPAGLRRWAENTLAAPTVDWRTALRAAVRAALNYAAAGQADYTYTRPGRRRIPGIVTPAMHSPRVTATAVIDTSGSMSTAQVEAALAEIRGIVDATRSRLSVIAVDTEPDVTHNVRDGSQVALTGGGGTDMRVGINEALRARPQPDVIVVLTDGYTPWPQTPTAVPLVVALVGEHTGQAPKWATTVQVTTP